jgi:hypothetical protein
MSSKTWKEKRIEKEEKGDDSSNDVWFKKVEVRGMLMSTWYSICRQNSACPRQKRHGSS